MLAPKDADVSWRFNYPLILRTFVQFALAQLTATTDAFLRLVYGNIGRKSLLGSISMAARRRRMDRPGGILWNALRCLEAGHRRCLYRPKHRREFDCAGSGCRTRTVDTVSRPPRTALHRHRFQPVVHRFLPPALRQSHEREFL